MKEGIYTEDLDDKLGEMGFIIDPDLELEEGALNHRDVIEKYKSVYRAIKLLILSENISEEKLNQAMDLAQGMK